MRQAAIAVTLALLAASPGAAQGKGEFSDAAIEQRKAQLDEAFAQVQVEADREFQDSVAFHARLKQRRLDFERERLVARKQMLDSLKGLPAAERKAAYDRFHAADARKRQDFAREVSAEKAVFRRQYLEERQDARRQEKRRRASR